MVFSYGEYDDIVFFFQALDFPTKVQIYLDWTFGLIVDTKSNLEQL